MPKHMDGLILPDDLYDTARAHQAGGGIPLMGILDYSSECSNCGGAGMLGLYLLSGQGFQYPLQRGQGSGHYHDGLWYRSRLQTYPCPVCGTDDRPARITAYLEMSGLEMSERDWSLSYIAGMRQKDEAYQAAVSMLAETTRPCGWLFLYGDNGVGKSGILKSAVAQACRQGISARYTTAQDILNEIYDLIDRNKRRDDEAETIHELTYRYERYQVLAIDEIGIDRVATTQFAQAQLFGLIDTRYNRRHEQATLIASNNTPAQLAGTVWKYFENRTRDGARVPVGGEVLRGRKAAAK